MIFLRDRRIDRYDELTKRFIGRLGLIYATIDRRGLRFLRPLYKLRG
ncbi:MAG: hypothetical protein LBF86_09455 [Helicobacteraceae bacterium]|nr:hypothetical protein [Helicobacteraceae bacterium]